MAKLTKSELARHNRACQLLAANRPLTLAEIEEVHTCWHPGAESNQTASSAFFTPIDMASDLRIECPRGGSIVDLCAGTGRLAYFAGGQHMWEEYRHQYDRIVCVERNPAYVELGKRLLPAAEWICGDVLDPAVRRQIGQVDFAISNPPFGTTTKSEFEAPRYKGAQFDLKVMDVAATLAPHCIAIVPADRAQWDYRGDFRPSKQAQAFEDATGLGLHRFASLDCDYYRDDWQGVSPSVELVTFGDEVEAEHRPTRTIHTPADHSAQIMALRAASPLRPVAGRTADVDGLALFDRVRQPDLFEAA